MIRIRQHHDETVEIRQVFDLADRGLLLADGVFDTSMVRAGKIVLMEDHIARLAGDCAALGIPAGAGELRDFARKAMPADTDGALRLTVTRGPGPRGLAPQAHGSPTLISRFDAGLPPFPAPPVRLTVSGIRRNPTAPSSRHKTLAYTDSVIGMQRAKAAGFDDALYLTPGGQVTCTSMANLFARFGNELVTPPLEDGVLKGVIRGWLLSHGAETGLTVRARSLRLEDVKAADSLYLTNSLQPIRPVAGLDEASFDSEIPPRIRELLGHLMSS